MNALPLYVFKDSFGPIVSLLNKHGVSFQEQETRSAEIMASGFTLEIAIDGSTWLALAMVIVAYLRAENDHEVFIVTKDNRIIRGRGLDLNTLQDVLKDATTVTVADAGSVQGNLK